MNVRSFVAFAHGIQRLVRAALRWLLLVVLALLGVACGPMIYGGNSPATAPSHFVLEVENLDVAAAETASVCWWQGSTIVGSAAILMPAAGGFARFDLGTVPPDGLQIVTTAWNGILMGPGGLCFGSTDYAGTWVFHVVYPSGYSWK